MFSITIVKDELAKALSFVGGSTNKEFPNMYMMVDDTGSTIIIYTRDRTSSSEIALPIGNVATPGDKCAVLNYNKFTGIINTIPDGECVDIIASGSLPNNTLPSNVLIKYGNKKPTKLNGVNASFPPRFSATVTGSMTLPCDRMNDISKSARVLTKGANNTGSISMSSCVEITTDGTDGHCITYDPSNKRIYCGNFSTPTPNAQMTEYIDPAVISTFANIIKPYYDSIVISEDVGILAITPDDSNGKTAWFNSIVYYAGKLAGNFPQLYSVFNNLTPNEWAEIEISDVLETIGKVKAIFESSSGSLSNAIKITISGIIMNISYSSIYGEIDDDINLINPIGGSMSCMMNYESLLDILKSFSTKTFMIGEAPNSMGNYFIKDSNSPSVESYAVASYVVSP